MDIEYIGNDAGGDPLFKVDGVTYVAWGGEPFWTVMTVDNRGVMEWKDAPGDVWKAIQPFATMLRLSAAKN